MDNLRGRGAEKVRAISGVLDATTGEELREAVVGMCRVVRCGRRGGLVIVLQQATELMPELGEGSLPSSGARLDWVPGFTLRRALWMPEVFAADASGIADEAGWDIVRAGMRFHETRLVARGCAVLIGWWLVLSTGSISAAPLTV